MQKPPLWERLRSAHIVQVGAVYLGGSWFALQMVDTLQGLLSLPDWVGPVAVALLLVGLFVVLATAWVQSLPQTTAAEEAGEVPTDWEVAPADAFAALMKGRLPHLTWGRALTGGAMSLALLFGFAGLAVLVRAPGSLISPSEAGAEGTSQGIAVLPFQISGEGLDAYREGMVGLMSANLDGLSRYRAIDARTVLARWNREIGENEDADLDRALRVASATGARYAVVGSGVEAGPRIRFTAEIYDLADGTQAGDGGQVEGSPEEVLELVDALTVEVVRSLLDATGQGSMAQDFRLASLLTESVPALRHYLEGDALFRRSRFEEAREVLHRAVEEDSTFALAYWRLGETYGWLEGIGAREGRDYKRRAQELAERLPEREATLLDITSAIGNFTLSLEEIADLRAYIRRYPDDPDGWYLLGEAGLHGWTVTGISDQDLEEALYRTIELDPTFGPYYEHALHWATAKGHADRYEALMVGAEEAGDALARRERMELRWALFQGDEATQAAAAARLEEMEPIDVNRVDQAAMGLLDSELDRLEPLWVHRGNVDELRIRLYGEQGRLAEMVRLAETLDDGALADAVWRLIDWSEEGHVSDELFRRLDEALGPRTPADQELFDARVTLDEVLGRPVDTIVVRAAMDQDIDEFLPFLLADQVDTTGIRSMVYAQASADRLARAGRRGGIRCAHRGHR